MSTPVTNTKRILWKTKNKEYNILDQNEVSDKYLQEIYSTLMNREYLAQEQISDGRVRLDNALFLSKKVKEVAKQRGIVLEPSFRSAEMVRYFHAKDELIKSNEI
jgi:hypothetical protein